MDELSRLAQDLDPSLSDTERAELVAVGMRLHAARPIPVPTFRGDLKRHLFGFDTGRARWTERPTSAPARNGRSPRPTPAFAARTLRLRIAASAGSGFGLLALAALGLAGAGPFAA